LRDNTLKTKEISMNAQEAKTFDHQVQVWNHKGSRRTRWYACQIVGRHPAPHDFVAQGFPEDWYDVRLTDGTVITWCNPECVRVRTRD